MKNTIYVIGPKSLFDEEFAQFEQGQGWYFENNFSNWGAVRHNLAGTLTLLEEEEHKFKPEHLVREDVTVYTEAEIQQYLQTNKTDWEEEITESWT